MLLRQGIRSKLFPIEIGSPKQVDVVFYPKYQKKIYNDLHQQLLMPDELKSLWKATSEQAALVVLVMSKADIPF